MKGWLNISEYRKRMIRCWRKCNRPPIYLPMYMPNMKIHLPENIIWKLWRDITTNSRTTRQSLQSGMACWCLMWKISTLLWEIICPLRVTVTVGGMPGHSSGWITPMITVIYLRWTGVMTVLRSSPTIRNGDFSLQLRQHGVSRKRSSGR